MKVISFQILKKPSSRLNKGEIDSLKKEISDLVKRSWGNFDNTYIEESIFKAYILCLAKDGEKVVGVAPLKKLNIFGSDVYSFGLTVVDPKYRGNHLLDKMGFKLGKSIILENLLRLKFRVELMFITPNIRTLGTIARISSYIYPDPYSLDKNGKMPEADDESWKRIKEFLRVSNEKYTNLEREGSIMEGFYDDKKELAYKNIEHKNPKLETFGKNYVYTKPGREVVVRAIVSVWRVFNA